MSKFIISCCSTADMSKEYFDKRDIKYSCFHYYLDGVHYRDDFGQCMPLSEFYQRMVDGAETKTSQINADEFIDAFTPYLEQGMDILHVSLSSGISGVFNSANVAKEELQDRYPDRKIIVLDSLNASVGYGLLMDKLADLRDAGMSIEETAAYAEEHKLEIGSWFFSTDLTFFVKGGRVSKTAGFVGGLLNICPLLNINSEGKLIPMEKIRTKKKVIKALVGKMEQDAKDGHDYSGKVFLSHSACLEDAKEVAALLKTTFPKMDGDPVIMDIGTTIGSHTGPGTVAMFYWAEGKRN